MLSACDIVRVMSRNERAPAEPKVALPAGFAFLIPAILAAMSMLGPFSIDTPFPAFQQMARDLDVTSAEMQLVISAYLVSFGLMSPFWGPLSDAIGRRPVMIGGVTAYVVASVGCALSPSLPVLLAFRVVQGLVVGGGVIVSRTIIRDVFEGAQAQRLVLAAGWVERPDAYEREEEVWD